MASLNDPRPARAKKMPRPCSKCDTPNHYGYWMCWKCDHAVKYDSDAERAEVYQINARVVAKKGPEIKFNSAPEPKYLKVQNTKTGQIVNSPTKDARNLQSRGTHKIIGGR